MAPDALPEADALLALDSLPELEDERLTLDVLPGPEAPLELVSLPELDNAVLGPDALLESGALLGPSPLPKPDAPSELDCCRRMLPAALTLQHQSFRPSQVVHSTCLAAYSQIDFDPGIRYHTLSCTGCNPAGSQNLYPYLAAQRRLCAGSCARWRNNSHSDHFRLGGDKHLQITSPC